jgi:FkbH-like protein
MASKALCLTDLPWLPRLSADFRTRLQSIDESAEDDWGPALRSLATQYIGLNQAMAISRTLNAVRARGPSPSLSRFKLGLVSNATTDFLKPMLEASALRYGLSLELSVADFGQIVQEALDAGSLINRARPDAVLLAIDHRGLPFRTNDRSQQLPFDPGAALDQIAATCEAFEKRSGATCLVQTLPTPPQLLFGSLDAALAGTLRASIARFNAVLASDFTARGNVLVDVDWLAQCVGLENWYDDRYWFFARLPFSHTVLPLYADFVCRIAGAMRGKSRKCLVLDLDNTLWGGVIGDDGLKGIALSEGDPRGETYRAIQTAAADLRRRGVVLAVCSKNDESTAREPFRSHPGMVLKEEDITVFIANWDDKATNLERIARRLDLGLDSMVLLDDNPAERALVRTLLPEVAVPELGDDPSLYIRTLSAAGYFESVGFTKEDVARADQYKGNSDRAQLLETSRNLDDFLRSLEMNVDFAPFDAMGRKRITQLINKTNQFNVTTRRYTEKQVASLETSSDHYTLQVNVRDRFGDNGMIGVVICEIRPGEWEIDTWLMSCRVLNRKIEEAICNRIAIDARRAGVGKVIGTYLPTDRNGIARDLFQRLGFDASDAHPGDLQGSTRWVLDVARFVLFDVPMAERLEPLADQPAVP